MADWLFYGFFMCVAYALGLVRDHINVDNPELIAGFLLGVCIAIVTRYSQR